MKKKEDFQKRMLPFRIKHGLYKHPLYFTWIRMRVRCSSKDARYKHWSGRGISVCKEWDDFATFLADMGEKPSKKHSLDRINNNGNYCKENCRWATWEEQLNNRRTNKLLTFEGKTQTHSMWAHERGLRVDTLHWRLKNGWSITKALNTKV